MELYYLGQLALGFLLGGMLGWQRERSGRAAGSRTYALVTGGAALFTLVSMRFFNLTDASRIIAQIITGIGFIGAGTILHRADRIEGVTTAAGLWITTAIGIAIGLESYFLAIGSALLTLGVLILDDKKILKIEQPLPSKKSTRSR